MHTVEKAQENKTIDPNESVWTTRGIERNSRKNRTADDRLIGCPGTGGTTAIGLRGSWLDTYMRGSAGKRSTNAAWCASNQRGVASCRAGRFIHQDPGYNATRKIPFFSLLSAVWNVRGKRRGPRAVFTVDKPKVWECLPRSTPV